MGDDSFYTDRNIIIGYSEVMFESNLELYAVPAC